MNWIFSRRLAFCLGSTTMPILGSGLLAQAETTTANSTKVLATLSIASPTQMSPLLLVKNYHPKPEAVSSTSAPLLGTTTTSADALDPDSARPASQTSAPANTTPTATFAQANTTTTPPLRPQNYIGLGGDIGLNGHKTSLGGGGLAILDHTRLAKLGNSAYLSLHDSTVVFGNRTATSTFALTISTPIQPRLLGRRVVVFPFLGGGLLTRQNNEGSTKVAPLLSAGIDVPIARRFTATARINAGFLAEDTEVGLQLGIGYNFSLFGRR